MDAGNPGDRHARTRSCPSKTFTLTLEAGKYTFYCQPPETSRFGNFTVS
jgi:plastocyanin